MASSDAEDKAGVSEEEEVNYINRLDYILSCLYLNDCTINADGSLKSPGILSTAISRYS